MFGITNEDINDIDVKLDKQRRFLKNFNMEFSDKNINMLDFTYSANLNPKKYFAEINNRVNTMFLNAKDKGLKPVFVTLTAPSIYHKKDKYGNPIISPNDTAKALTQVWNKFTNLQVFQRMKKELGFGLIYFRVYEPHKSSVPHLHAMIFIPCRYILEVKKKYKEYFSSSKWGANKRAIDFKYTWYKQSGGAVGYIMKYITKTFRNENSSSIQHAVYWYIKHKIRRFLSSRTLAPLSIYRKVRYYFKEQYKDDFYRVSKLIANKDIYTQFNGENIFYRYYDHEIGDIEEVSLWGKSAELLLHNRANRRLESIRAKNGRENLSIKIKKNKSQVFVVELNSIEKMIFNEFEKKFKKLPIVISKLSDYNLFNYYKKLLHSNIDSIDTGHFLLTKNELIKRGLITGKIESLNDTSSIYGF